MNNARLPRLIEAGLLILLAACIAGCARKTPLGPQPNQPPECVMLAVPYVRQETPLDCAPACLAMLLKYHSLPVNEAELAALQGADGVPGTQTSVVYTYLQSQRIVPIVFYPATTDELDQLLMHGHPVMVVQELTREGKRAVHSLIVVGFSRTENVYYVHDPYEGDSRPIDAAVFDERWLKGGGYVRLALAIFRTQDAVPDGVSFSYSHIAEEFERARFSAQKGEIGGALQGFENVVAAAPDFVPSYLWLGTMYAREKMWAEAEVAFANAVALDATYYWGLGLAKLGAAQFVNGNIEEAGATLRKFLDGDPTQLPAEVEVAKEILLHL